MRILLHEFVTGGGWHAVDRAPPAGSLLAEGAAMRDALLSGIGHASRAGWQVELLHDARLPPPSLSANSSVRLIKSAAEERAGLIELAPRVDGVLLIAPECAGLLAERCRWVEAAGGFLLGPGSEWVERAADKSRCAVLLRAAGVPTPWGVELAPDAALPRDFPYPAVLKPVDGAGSLGVVRIDGCDDPCSQQALRESRAVPLVGSRRRLEQFVPGLAASVALLTGPSQTLPLPAMRQILSTDGRFRYLGGEGPLPPELTARAQSLALRSLAALGPTRGYIGFDLVLGDDPTGHADYVIEVNPRCTTSVVGYAAHACGAVFRNQILLSTGQAAEDPSWGEFARFLA